MSVFERIHIQNFRRLQNVDLKLNPLNVLIGANGIGKTSLLDVFSLLSASASGQLNTTMKEMGGFDSNLSNQVFDLPSEIRFILKEHNPDQWKSHYEIALGKNGMGYGYVIDSEKIELSMIAKGFHQLILRNWGPVQLTDSRSGTIDRKEWRISHIESVLSQVPPDLTDVSAFRQRLASSTHYHVLDVSRRAPIRLPQQIQDAKLPGHDGEDLVSCLFNLRETEPDSYEAIEATLLAGFPDFERLNFPPVAAGTLAMTWKDKSSKSPFYMHQLSEGTLRFLWLVTLLQSPALTEITMIDEPEVSLHPELLMVIADLLRNASRRTQLIVATHSDRLIRYLKPADVVTISQDEHGAAQFMRADELDLESWLEEYSLDQLWQNGVLGARP